MMRQRFAARLLDGAKDIKLELDKIEMKIGATVQRTLFNLALWGLATEHSQHLVQHARSWVAKYEQEFFTTRICSQNSSLSSLTCRAGV